MPISYKKMTYDAITSGLKKFLKKNLKEKIVQAGKDSIVIVGAGITGSYLAWQLADEAINVTVLEKAPAHFFEPTYCQPITLKTITDAKLPASDNLEYQKKSLNDEKLYLAQSPKPLRIHIGDKWFDLPLDYVMTDYRSLLKWLRNQASQKGAIFHYGQTAVGYENNIVVSMNNRSDVFRHPANLVLDCSGIKGGFCTRCCEDPLISKLPDEKYQYVSRCLAATPVLTGLNIKVKPFINWLFRYSDRMSESGQIVPAEQYYSADFKPFINGRAGSIHLQRLYAGRPRTQLVNDRLMIIGAAAGMGEPLTGLTIGTSLRSAISSIPYIQAALSDHVFTKEKLWAYAFDFYTINKQGARQLALAYFRQAIGNFSVEQYMKYISAELIDTEFLTALLDPEALLPQYKTGLLAVKGEGQELRMVYKTMQELYDKALQYPNQYDRQALKQWQTELGNIWKK